MNLLFVKLLHRRIQLECQWLFLFFCVLLFIFAVLAQKERFGSVSLAALLKKNCFYMNMFKNTLKKSAIEYFQRRLLRLFQQENSPKKIFQVSAEKKYDSLYSVKLKFHDNQFSFNRFQSAVSQLKKPVDTIVLNVAIK